MWRIGTQKTQSPYPLDGVVIVDLTHVLAGPYCSMLLAELGARVIKVERPEIGDDTRAFPPFMNGRSAYFASINRSKESIALNLKQAEDREVFENLLSRSDCVLENNRPGVMERLGYGWETIHERWPRLIYGAASGFGHSGPDSTKPAYDMIAQALSGVMSITGEADREPVRVGASIGDIIAGMFLAQGVLAALYDRENTGLGRKVDIAMLDGLFATLEHAVALFEATGESPKPSGARHPLICPFESYHTEDGLIVIAAGNDKLFAEMCAALGNTALAQDDRFKTNAQRCANADMLKRLMEVTLLEQPTAYWLERLEKAGVPSAPIQNIGQALATPQLLARNMIIETSVGRASNAPVIRAAGNPVKISGCPDPSERRAAPDLDEDRDAILAWMAATPPK